MAPLAARLFGDPSAELTCVAVTGTNGKTTTAFLVRSILEAAGLPCGLLGTVKQIVGGREEEVERTTPEAIDLQRVLRRMLDAGDRACVMEVSSHALVLGRADAIHFDAAAFTNLTQDHLDFHADMEDYFAAKRLLFAPPEGAGGVLPGAAVVNVDDPYGARLAEELEAIGAPPLTTFSPSGEREATLRGPRRRVRRDRDPLRPARGRRGRGPAGAPAPAGPLQRRERARRARLRRALGLDLGGAIGAAGRRRAGPGPLRADRRGPGLRRPRRLRPHPRLARERAARRPAADHRAG